MARARSTDSSQSATTSSNQASPKKKATALPTIKTAVPPAEPPALAPPPGLSAPPVEKPTTLDDADLLADSLSAESEAGPSIASPAPQTPARSGDQPPAPLTSDPIFLHSPYEEPRLSYFPTSDPAFAFSLGLDDHEIRIYQEAVGYQPSPFSKTLIGLAELGVLAPEIPDIPRTPPGFSGFTGSFQPFDSNDTESLHHDEAGPSRTLEGQDGPRTTSRFDFARPNSGLASRASPFAVRRGDDGRGNGWIGQQVIQDVGASHGESSSRMPSLSHQNYTGSSGGPFESGNSTWASGMDGIGGSGFQMGYGMSPLQPRHHTGGSGGGGYEQRENARYYAKGSRGDQEDFEQGEWLCIIYHALLTTQAINTPTRIQTLIHRINPLAPAMSFQPTTKRRSTPRHTSISLIRNRRHCPRVSTAVDILMRGRCSSIIR